MRKDTLLKYVSGKLDDSLKEEVLKWASKNPDNEHYLANLKNLWVSMNIPEEKASEREFMQIRRLIENKNYHNYTLDNSSKWTRYYRISTKHIWIAAACVAVLFTGALFISKFIDYKNSSTISNYSLAEFRNIPAKRILYTNRGVKATLVLPDSSVVWLNSDTKIEYPNSFDSTLRKVYISGEAYFDITKDTIRPMVISTDKAFAIKVTGTKLNLKAYDNDQEAFTTLYTGAIEVLSNHNGHLHSTDVLPNETCIVNNNNKFSKKVYANPQELSAWKDGKIIFDETPVSEVIKILERWHGVDFIVLDKEILKYKITATFFSESINRIMDLIQLTSFINYKIEGNKVYLSKR